MQWRVCPIKPAILLIGAGHAHLALISRWKTQQLISCPMVLINPSAEVWYSAMVPGVLAGNYQPEQARFNLADFCERNAVTFEQGTVVSLNRESSQVNLASGEKMDYLLASLDIGSEPTPTPVTGHDNALSLKPFSSFLNQMNQMFSTLTQTKPQKWAVLGAGAAGVEISCAIHQRLQQLGLRDSVQLFLVDPLSPVSSHGSRVQNNIKRALAVRDIFWKRGEVTSSDGRNLWLSGGLCLTADFVINATRGQAPQTFRLPQSAGAAPNQAGYNRVDLEVDDHLQVIGCNNLFAAGDIARMKQPQAKVGVIAIKQGRILHHNLLQRSKGTTSLQRYTPPKRFLNLISLGDGTAVLSHPWFSGQGRWVWWLKRAIDGRYIRQLKGA